MDTTERLLLGAEQRKYRTLLLAALGGVLENYDFILFALFTKVLSQLFFPPTMPEWIAIVQTFGIFAAGNLARPLGGIILAHYGDLLGRKRAFVFSMSLMGVATLGIASAPTYASIGGAAPIVLLLLRVLQGAATGGELPGAWTFVAEQVPKNRVGLACGVLVSALSVGNLLAALAVTALSRLFHPWEILAFAWRLPFMVGGIFALLSVYVRRWLTESPVFRELQGKRRLAAELPLKIVVCTENLIRVDDVMESPKLAE
jgi:MFS family permease